MRIINVLQDCEKDGRPGLERYKRRALIYLLQRSLREPNVSECE